MKNLEELLQCEEYKNLIASTEVASMIRGVCLKSGQGVLRYGSVLGLTENDNFGILSDKTATDGSQIPIGILAETINTEETNKALILKTNHVEGQIPELNGYEPISVIYTGTNAIFNYDEATRTFTIDKTSTIGEDGRVTTSLSTTNSYGIKVTYPLEAYQTLGTEQVTIKIPVKTYYEGYNNPNAEFKNPYKSNTAQATITASYQKYVQQIQNTELEIKVGRRVYDPVSSASRYIISKQKPLKIYNGQSEEEKDDI